MIQTDQTRHPIIAILFDLDGTLLDSFRLHYRAYEVMFRHFGIEMSRELFLQTYSPNWYRTYEAFGLAAEHWELANSLWLDAANKHFPELFPGVSEMLHELSKIYKLGIVTSGSRSRVSKELERLQVAPHFATVVTGDDVTNPKPEAEGLKRALDEINAEPNQAVYVGDALADFEMARAVGTRFFGVPSEFANLSHGHPEYDVRPISALPDTIRSWSRAFVE
jgi:HAD superfamily hydrolase (TIGR01549 family)